MIKPEANYLCIGGPLDGQRKAVPARPNGKMPTYFTVEEYVGDAPVMDEAPPSFQSLVTTHYYDRMTLKANGRPIYLWRHNSLTDWQALAKLCGYEQ